MKKAQVLSLVEARQKRGFGRAPSAEEVQELFERDLARSGLDLKDGKKLKWQLFTEPDALWARLRPKRIDQRPAKFTATGYTLPHFQPDGKLINYIRVRKLSGAFGTEKDGKDQRYTQPPNTYPHLYVPMPLMDVPVSGAGKITIDGELIITEGEKKAAAACKFGIPTVALGGVQAFHSAKYDIALLEELSTWFDLSDTDLVFLFDTDIYGNKDVRAALYEAKTVCRQVLRPRPRSISEIALTHEVIGDRLALDDWLTSFGTTELDRARARREFAKLPRRQSLDEEIIAHYNACICYVVRLKCYYDIPNRTVFPSERSLNEQWGTEFTVLRSGEKKPSSGIDIWLETRDTKISNVQTIVYEPGRSERFRESDADYETLNTWRKSPLQAIPYSAKTPEHAKELALFFDYWAFLTESLTEQERRWFLCWWAYPHQHPGAKLHSAVCAWSITTRVAKSTFSNINERAYGRANYHQSKGATWKRGYNERMETQFFVTEEIHLAHLNERHSIMETMKSLITDHLIEIDQKYRDLRNARNVVNFYFTSNEPDALALEPNDQRFFVLHVPERRKPEEFYKALYAWLEGPDGDQSGYARVLGFLQAVDTSKFNPHAPPPRTAAWHAMLAAGARGRGAVGDLVDLLVADPDAILAVGGNRSGRPSTPVFSAQHLVEQVSLYAKNRNLELPGGLTRQRLGLLLNDRLPKRAIKFKRAEVTMYAVYARDRWREKPNSAWKARWLTFQVYRKG